MRAAIYVRVSTKEQAREKHYSLPTQIESCRAYIEEMGWDLDERHIYREADTGTIVDRPALDQVLEDARRDEFDVLVVHKFDRLAREEDIQKYIAVDLRRKGVSVESALERYDDSPMGQWMRTIAGMVASQERRDFIERSKRGRRARAQKGKYPVGPRAPFGYAYADEDKSRLVIYEDQAQTIRWMFERAADGWGVNRIATRLREEGVAHSSGKSSWYPTSVRDIIRNELYKGIGYAQRHESYKDRYGKTKRRLRPREEWIVLPDGVVPPIVSESLWDAANHGIDSRRKGRHGIVPESKNANMMMVNGEVVCGICGTAMTRVAGITGRGYRDSKDRYVHSFHAADVNKCTKSAVNHDILDEWVWGELVAFLSDTQRLEELMQFRRKLRGINPFRRNAEMVAAALKERREEHTKAMDTFTLVGAQLDELSRQQMIDTVKRLAESVQKMERELRVLKEQEQAIEAEQQRTREFEKLLPRLAGKLVGADLERRRFVMKAFGVRVEMFPYGSTPRFKLYISPSLDSMERIFVAQTPDDRASIITESTGTRSTSISSRTRWCRSTAASPFRIAPAWASSSTR